MKLKTIIALFTITLVVIFSIQNVEVTEVKFLKWTISMSRVLIILGSFAIGIIVGILVSMKKRILPKKQLKNSENY